MPNIVLWSIGEVQPVRISPSSLKAIINSGHSREPFANIINPFAQLSLRETDLDRIPALKSVDNLTCPLKSPVI